MSKTKERTDPYKDRCYELAIAAGLDPDGKIDRPGQRPIPVWCTFRQVAREEANAAEAKAMELPPQLEKYKSAPLIVKGEHDEATIQQMMNCMQVGNVMGGVICADGHVGYAQPVGGVIAYEKQISISGVGFDIGCGNMAVRLDTKYEDIKDRADLITKDIAMTLSFGVGRKNKERVDHPLFDDDHAWKAADREDYRPKAREQLGTIGSGNHYVDLFRDDEDHVWIGVHFGSRGLGHSSAMKYLKAAGGKDGMFVPPAVVDEGSEIGTRYLAAMHLAGRYAYAGREWACERVRQIIGGNVVDSVHNHHNFAWRERHLGTDLWVVRKGATPAFPGQRGFIGGSMGDDAVIVEGLKSPEGKASLYSTVHGAGRLFSRTEAKRRFHPLEMERWIRERGVHLIGAGLDESPMAYRRLPEVLAAHIKSVKIQRVLHPFSVVMAGNDEIDPWKD